MTMRPTVCTYLRIMAIAVTVTAISRMPSYADSPPAGTLLSRITGTDLTALPSPETSAPMRHIEHSIDYSTGKATIAIPLHVYSTPLLSVPITLRGQTGAVKVDEESGNIGKGWELDCGGFVARSVVGLPDELKTVDVRGSAYAADASYLMALMKYEKDSHHDRYTYMAGGYSGSFLYAGGQIVNLTDDDCTVEILPGGPAEGFLITVPDGTRYRYDIPEQQDHRITTLTCTGIPEYPGYSGVPCMWRLGSITDRTGADRVTFTYDDASVCHRGSGGKVYCESIKTDDYGSSTFISASNGTSSTTHTFGYTGRHILKEISGRAGKVIFTNAVDDMYDPIDFHTGFSVVNDAGSTVRKVSFSYMARGTEDLNRDILLKGYRVTAGDSLIDSASFTYHHEDDITPRKDLFGYCNKGAYETIARFVKLGSDDCPVVDHETTDPNKNFREFEKDIVQKGYLRWNDYNYLPPNESVVYVRNDTLMLNPFRQPHQEGMYYGAIHTIDHSSGTVTEFEYEPATVPYAIQGGGDSTMIGLRLVKETVSDRNTGVVRERSLSYRDAKPSVDLSAVGWTDFMSVSGTRETENTMSDYFPSEYATTGVILTTCSNIPGAPPENAVAYHGKVTETITGTGIGTGSPSVTVYEYDLSGLRAERGNGGRTPNITTGNDIMKYAGAESRQMDWTTTGRVHKELYQIPAVQSYEREIIGPRAPLRKITEYVHEDGEPRPLRVTEIATSLEERDVLMGYHCQLQLRNIRQGATARYATAVTPDDFCHFPIKAVVRRAYTDTVKVTEYDRSGNSRTVTTVHTYNNHGASVADNGLPYRTVTSCGGESTATTRTYASTDGSGLKGRTDAISLPVCETVTRGLSTTETRIRYSNMADGAGSPSGLTVARLLPSAIVTSHNGTVVDSIAIKKYDDCCNPAEASVNGTAPETFGWGYSGTLLTSVTRGGLTTRYEHEPLVGCTAVVSPGGTRRTYAYQAGRLWKQAVAGQTVAEYDYRLCGLSETDGVNSITTRSITGNGTGPCSTVRYDGFGAEIVSCVSPSGSSGEGILSLTRRDALSRPQRTYMPFTGAWADEFEELDYHAEHAYPDDREPFVATVHESALSGRTLSATLGGEAFRDHPVRSGYMFNTTDGGALTCRRYTSTTLGGGSLRSTGYWPKGTLAVTVVSDADGRATYEFTDFRGRTVLVRRTTGGTPAYADTHYVYDDAGNLVFILQPAASAALASSGTWNPAGNNTLREHAYVFRYDTKNRIMSSKAPGVGETLLWHDLSGSQVFSQDPVQREKGVMSFALTDDIGRPAVSGECTYSSATAERAATVILRARPSQTWDTALAGYAVDAMQLPGAVAHTAVYYDGYTFLQLAGFAPLRTFTSSKGYLPARSSSAGLATGSYSKLLGEDGAVLSVSYLDGRERTVRSVSSAMPSGFLVTETSYSNTDKPLSAATTHFPPGGASNVLRLDHTYDSYDRPSGMTVTLNGTAVTSTADTYSPEGRHTRRTFGGTPDRAISYTYTTRGDVASITAPDFVQTLTYSADSCRNGNIRTSSWRGKDDIQRSYTFSYDGMNRLTRAAYNESGRTAEMPYNTKLEGTPDYTETMAYDLSSNPVRIRRAGVTEVPANRLTGTLRFGMCDDITLTYSGERLVRADDAGATCRYSGASDFADGASSSVEYTYDANGNMLSDANKGISATYNRLDRAQTVEAGGFLLRFVHDSSGNMLRRTHRLPLTPLSAGSPLLPLSVGSEIPPGPLHNLEDTVSYCGPFEYKGGTLSRVNFPGGYVSGGVVYHYVHDHQGNVRQVINAATGEVAQENHYYPGGMLFAESSATYFSNGSANNLYRYGGKELLTTGGLDLSLFGARMYDAALLRFITPDPLRHDTPHLSSYLFCAANPVMYVDPTGLSTRVVDNGNGTYRVIGGALDGDLRIFLCENEQSESGIPIGVTPVETSFYNSEREEWVKDAIIDPNDNSGIDFITAIMDDTPGVCNYSRKAYGGQLYDFKVTNGTETKEDDNRNHYRGMPIQIIKPPLLPVYSSARDIGNMMAGYVMGYNGLPWGVVRRGFDRLETLQNGMESTEGASSQNAQKYGYGRGLNQRINIEGKAYPHLGYLFIKIFYETMIRVL